MNIATLVAVISGCQPSPNYLRAITVAVSDAETGAPLPGVRIAVRFVSDTPDNCQSASSPAPDPDDDRQTTDENGQTVILTLFFNCEGGPLLFELPFEEGMPAVSVEYQEGAVGTGAGSRLRSSTSLRLRDGRWPSAQISCLKFIVYNGLAVGVYSAAQAGAGRAGARSVALV